VEIDDFLKAPPQCAQHTGSRHRSYWPSMDGGLYGGDGVGTRGEREWKGEMRENRRYQVTKNLLCDYCEDVIFCFVII
jgi:hypothetical protein